MDSNKIIKIKFANKICKATWIQRLFLSFVFPEWCQLAFTAATWGETRCSGIGLKFFEDTRRNSHGACAGAELAVTLSARGSRDYWIHGGVTQRISSSRGSRAAARAVRPSSAWSRINYSSVPFSPTLKGSTSSSGSVAEIFKAGRCAAFILAHDVAQAMTRGDILDGG